MSTVTIRFVTGNAAFESDTEIGATIRRTLETMESALNMGGPDAGGPIRDTNGNTIGEWRVE